MRELVESLAEGGRKATHLYKAVIGLRLAEAAAWYARVEVMAARERGDASWADVGKALGINRRAALEHSAAVPRGCTLGCS